MREKIGFIGAGNMASTMIKGFINKFTGINQLLYLSNRTRKKARDLSKEVSINYCRDNIELAKTCDWIFLAIKPDMYKEVLEEISPYVGRESLIISLAAGVNIASIEKYFQDKVKVIRIMPNLPVAVNEGMISLSKNKSVLEEEKDLLLDLLTSIGKVDEIEESMIDSTTTISGSSPAFIAMFVEALADGSVLAGMPRDKAYTYAAQTLIGTGKMLLEEKIHPGQIKDMVSSPKGVTIEGVKKLEEEGFRNIIMETVKVCERKMKG